MKKILCWGFVFLSLPLFARDMILNTTETLFIWPGQSRLIISVKADPQSGYDWHLAEYSWDHFNLVGQGFLKSQDSEFLGAPGHYQYILEILKPFDDIQNIVLALKAPWEDHPIITKTFMVRTLETTQGPVY